MSKVAVVSDSAAGIPEDMLEELRIHTIPFYIHHGGKVLRDFIDISCEKFYQWLPTLDTLPTTSNPGPGDYLEKYKELAAKGFKNIISIQITSLGSGAYRAAMVAKEMLRESLPEIKLEVIDTLNASMCQGWMAVEAARAALTGASFPDIVAMVKKMIPVSHMFQTTDSLRYLYMGGRIGKAKHLVANMLNIKPIIGMEDGVVVALGQARSRKKVYQAITDKMSSAVSAGAVKVSYVHAAALEEAEKLKSIVEERINVVESVFSQFSPALGVHTGPGTVGLCYYPLLD